MSLVKNDSVTPILYTPDLTTDQIASLSDFVLMLNLYYMQVFDGNIDDAKIPVTNMFDQSIMATIVRIETVAYKHGIALRLELLGCYTEVE